LFLKDWLSYISDAIGNLRRSTNADFQIFARTPESETKGDIEATKHILRGIYDTSVEVNKEYPGLIAGIYIVTSLDTFEGYFKLIADLFNSADNQKIPLGLMHTDCRRLFINLNETTFRFELLRFISCKIHPRNHPSPEKQADQALKTCTDIISLSERYNMSVEIFCRISYPSGGLSPRGIINSDANFEKFWCHIFNSLRISTKLPIVFDSAFDVPLGTKGQNKASIEKYPNTEYLHYGWWKRINNVTDSSTAFVEKVDGKENIVDCWFYQVIAVHISTLQF